MIDININREIKRNKYAYEMRLFSTINKMSFNFKKIVRDVQSDGYLDIYILI